MSNYGLLGEKLGHSFSKILHAQMNYEDYDLFSIPKDEVDNWLAKAEFEGINVTIPYKEVAMKYCEPDEIATAIGCVNTLVKREGKMYGFNTDCLGFAFLAKSIGVKWEGKKVVILGSGGTSKTARYVALISGAKEVVIVSRSKSGDDADARISFADYTETDLWKDAQILVNTTPVGMYPKNEGCPVDVNIFDGLEAVVDVVYNPLNTKLVLAAKAKGIPATCGLPMLVAQGYYAEVIWDQAKNGTVANNSWVDCITGKQDDTEAKQVIEKVVANMMVDKQNIVIVGMPGSGKSTIGAELSKKLNHILKDTDEEFEKTFGVFAGDYITEHGIDAFRDGESQVVREVSKESGIIIATGGGAVLREENRDALRENGKVVLIKRDLDSLATEGRPLSASREKLEELYKTRMPIYEAFCDIEVENNGSPEEVADEVLKKLGIR